jgi:chromosome segregation ATPase
MRRKAKMMNAFEEHGEQNNLQRQKNELNAEMQEYRLRLYLDEGYLDNIEKELKDLTAEVDQIQSQTPGTWDEE